MFVGDEDKLPELVEGSGGTIKIILVPDLPGSDTEDTMGIWKPVKRTIEILDSLPLEMQWSVLFHELTHAALSDTGIASFIKSKNLEESICDAVSLARIHEKFGR